MKTLIDPWSSNEIKNYDKLMEEFGIEKITTVPKPHHYFSRNIIYGHKDIQRIGNAVKNQKPFVLLTGMMPSGAFHIGHKVVADQIIYWQSLGAKVYIVVADIESYLTRNISFQKAKEIAFDQYILNYIALGLKPKNTKIYFQSTGPSNYQTLSKIVAKGTTINQIKGLYGQPTLKNILAPLTQAADILYPQIELGPIPTIVPVGFDQVNHINLTRDIASKLKEYNFIPPSATFNKFLPGLQGGKMSSSDPLSYISLTDSEETIKDKIHKYAFSGGKDTLKEHREKGGNPEIDISYQWITFLEPSDKKLKKIYDEYKSGKLLTRELKEILINYLNTFIKKHKKARIQAKKDLTKFKIEGR